MVIVRMHPHTRILFPNPLAQMFSQQSGACPRHRPTSAAMEDDLSSLLRTHVGEEWLEPLAGLGVRSLDDFRYLAEADFSRIGMTVVQMRRLQAAYQAEWVWTPWNGSFFPEHMQVAFMQMGLPPLMMVSSEAAGDPADLRLPSLSELQVLQHVLGNKEVQAIDSLDIALAALEIEIIVGENQDVIKSVNAAKEQLLDSRRTIGLAIHAENATRRALTALRRERPRRALECAERRIRDAIVLRAQMSTPLGSRTIFMKTLEDAYGGDMNLDVRAKMMHAHNVVVGPLFMHSFVSRAKQEAAARHSAPRAQRVRNTKRQAAAAESSEDADQSAEAASSSSTSQLQTADGAPRWCQGPLHRPGGDQ